MALNPQNLKPPRSTEEARERGSKGGKASVESRRRKKDLKAKMKALLELPVTDTKQKEVLEEMGVEEIDNATLMLVGLFQAAISGDVSAVKEIRNILGEERRTSLEKAEIKAKTKLLQANASKIDGDSGDSSEGGVVLMPAILESEDKTSEVVIDE